MSKWLQNVYYFVLGSILLLSSTALAINGRTTYQAKIYKPDGLPLEAVSVNFRFTVLDPSSSCVLYVEDYAAVNMIGSGGLTSFGLGMGTRTYPASGPVTFASVFDNSTPSYVCQVPGVYNPISTDNRKIVMQFNEGSGWQTLPAMAINSVPYAMYSAKAQNAQQLNGKADTSFVEYSALASLNCQTNEAIKFNGVSFSCIAVGVSSSGISSVTTSGTVLTTTGTASAPVISINVASMSSDGYLTSVDYAEFKAKLSASSTQIVNTLGYAPVSGAAVNSQIQASQLSGDVSGTVSANIVQSVGGKTAAQVSISVNDTLAATSSATADTIVKRNSSGNITVNDIYANAAKVNYVDIYKPSTSFNIRLEAPTSLAANYTLALPTTSGSVGQVLSTDGSGNLSWINPSTGSVTSVSAVAPLSSTGGATPTISISQATSSANGYLSSADWNTFNNKQQATSAAIIATLGYTPANATSSTQWTTNGSHIYYSTGNVGIGVSNPVHPLDVLGQLRAGSATDGSAVMGNDGNAFIELREYDGAGTPYMDFANDPSIDFDFRFILEGDDNLTMKGGNVGIGVFAQSALLHLGAGSATNGPLRFTSGTLLTSPLSGTMEYDGSNFYLTDGTNQRRTIATGYSQGSIDNASQINSTGNMTLNPMGSVIVSSTAASTDANTGALIVKGGLGVAGTANIGGNLNVSGSSVIDGSLRLSSMTSGSVLFAGANGTVTQDNANFYWDGGNRRLGLGTTAPSALLHLSSSSQTLERIRLSGQEFYQAGNTDAEGLSLLLGVNRTGNRQLWIGDSAKLTQNTSNTILRLSPSSGDISSLATDGVTVKNLLLNANGGNVGIGTTTPTNTLSISGTANITGGLVIGDGTQNSAVARLDAANYAWYGWYLGGVRTAFIQSTATEYSIYSQKSGVPMTLYTSSTERVRLDANGNLGIGTTNPQRKLHLSNSGSAEFVIEDPAEAANSRIWRIQNYQSKFHFGAVDDAMTTDTKILTLQRDGNVGIGTTAPASRLHVGLAGTESVQLGSFKIVENWAMEYWSQGYKFMTINAGVADVAFLGTVSAGGNGFAHADAKFKQATVIGGSAGGTLISGYDGIQLDNTSFYGAPTTFSFAGVEKVRIASTGNVGIGTTTPSFPLSVSGTIQGRGIGYFTQSSPVNSLAIDATSSTLHSIYTNAPSVDLSLGTNNSTSQLYLKNNGNVGIGTTAPSEKLEVNGFVKAQGFKTSAMSVGAELLYVRGTGLNNNASRLVKLGNQTLVSSGARGLTLTIIEASTHNHISSTNYDTYGSTIDSDNLATALNNLTRDKIGILSSYDSWESNITANLRAATRRLGLYKLTVATEYRAPYVAIFYGAGTATNNTEVGRQAYEILQNGDGDSSYALLTTWIMEDGFIGQNLTNALTSGNPNTTDPVVLVDSTGKVGVGTTNPGTELQVYKTKTGVTTISVGNSVSSTNDGASLQLLYGATEIGSYNYYWTGSQFQNRLNYYGDLAFTNQGVEKARITSTGNVGIGTTSPVYNLDVAGAALIRGGAAHSVAAPSYGGTYFSFDGPTNTAGLWATNASTSQFAFYTKSSGTDPGTERMRITDIGRVGIGTTSPSYGLDVNGDIRITGTPYRNGGDSAWIVPSDARLKDVVSKYNRGLNEILNIDTIIFKYKKDNPKQIDSSVAYTGVLAQQVQKQIPEAVKEDQQGFLSLNTTPIFWAVVNAIKELYYRMIGVEEVVSSMQREVASVKADSAVKDEKIKELEQRLQRLEKALEKKNQ